MFANCFQGRDHVECGLVRICPINDWTTEKYPIPLQSVQVDASIVHSVAQVQITQVFVNKEEQPIEAVYYFPVDPNGAVTHFEAEVEGRKIKGVVKAHEEAKEQYEKAIEQKQTAFLGEENKADIFKVRIGYLKPGNQAKIIVGYVTEVKNERDSNAIQFYVPTTVAPRYVPKNTTDEKAQDLKNMQFSETSPAPITIKTNVSIQGAIKSIESPTHKIVVSDQGPVPEKKEWTKATVELSGTTTDMDRDFVLLVTPAEPHKPRLYLEKLEKSLAVMAHLIPSFKLKEQKVELIFILDRSGSMQGLSIQLAKKALTLFLHSLPDDCYFNIVGFGSSYKMLFPKSVKYDDGTLKEAAKHAKELDADMGGTEILEPLKHIYGTETIPGYLRQIFVITDGEVGNTDEVIGLTKAKAHESRVFALGIGDGASHHLVEGIARAGGGNSAFVTYNEPVDKKVLQQLKDALQPSLTDVRLTWHGVTAPPPEKSTPPVPVNTEKTLMGYGKAVEAPAEKSTAASSESAPAKRSYRQAPERIPPIFDGSQLLVFGVFENPDEKPTGCTITAESPDGPLSVEIQLSEENDVGSTGMLHKLAAIKIVREIELKVAALGFDYNDPDGGSGKPEEKVYKQEIIEIAVREGIASKYTSFIAVDTGSDSKSAENWVMQTRMVPSQFTHGWHGGFGGGAAFHSPPMMMCASAGPGMRFGGGGGPARPRVKLMKRSAPSGNASSALFGSAPAPHSGVSTMKYCAPQPAGFAFAKAMETDDASDATVFSDGIKSAEWVAQAPPKEELDALEVIISFQSFNGSFRWEESLLKAIGLDFTKANEEAEKNGWDLSAWATALALAYLAEKLKERQESWELVAMKAQKWLSKNHGAAEAAITAAATALVKSA